MFSRRRSWWLFDGQTALVCDVGGGVVFSREQLLNAVRGQERAITDRAVDVYVLRLRQKVDGGRCRKFTYTVGRAGCSSPYSCVSPAIPTIVSRFKSPSMLFVPRWTCV